MVGEHSERKLTSKQLKFIAAYDGNGTKAARLAGYKGNDKTLAEVAKENLRKPLIASEIKKRQIAEATPLIASRQQRQAFWTEVQGDETLPMMVRLRASELLGKSEADFTEKTQISGSLDTAVKVVITLPDNGFSAKNDESKSN